MIRRRKNCGFWRRKLESLNNQRLLPGSDWLGGHCIGDAVCFLWSRKWILDVCVGLRPQKGLKILSAARSWFVFYVLNWSHWMYSVRLSDLYPALISRTWRLIPAGERAVGSGRRGACRVLCEALWVQRIRQYGEWFWCALSPETWQHVCCVTPCTFWHSQFQPTIALSKIDCTWGVQVLRYPNFFSGNGSR